ncbi:MAG: DNA replication complex subunit Gins51 [Candidatus Methanospirareceae archaeon]
MDIEKLWEILYKERNTASLQELPQDFYSEAGLYLRKLEEEKEGADDKRRELIEDEIRNARSKIEDIIRRRIGKIVKIASSGVKTMPKGLVREEREIFEGVMSCVEEGRRRIMEIALGRGGRDLEMSEEKGERRGGKEEGEIGEKKGREEYIVVRILGDIPSFMGVDGRVYKLRREDVVMIPKINAEILCSNNLAQSFLKGKKFYR